MGVHWPELTSDLRGWRVAALTLPLHEHTGVCYLVNEGVSVAKSRKTRLLAAKSVQICSQSNGLRLNQGKRHQNVQERDMENNQRKQN